MNQTVVEPPHDKPNKMTFAPSEDSYQPGHPPSLIRVFAQWVAMKPRFLYAYSKDSDQTRRMPSRWAHVILLVLWCCGSVLFYPTLCYRLPWKLVAGCLLVCPYFVILRYWYQRNAAIFYCDASLFFVSSLFANNCSMRTARSYTKCLFSESFWWSVYPVCLV